ncbi:MAG: phosphoglycerate mutase family protein [Urechidicola sp.]|nr:phosphoglycerate mutase family protein [Urechidicola sp.]
MKKLLLFFFISSSFFSIYSQNHTEKASEVTTTYYLIRHSEKDASNSSDRNPNLSEIGMQRANSWVTILKEIEFDAIYSTNYNRTLQTAKPIADSNQLEIIKYDLSTFNFDDFKESTKGKTVLVVGHSNTTASFANSFIDKNEYAQIKESNYANLYIITITGDTVTHSLLKIN